MCYFSAFWLKWLELCTIVLGIQGQMSQNLTSPGHMILSWPEILV